MKKIISTISFCLVAGGALLVSSCTPQAPKASLKTELDSLAYAGGITVVNGLSDYVAGQGVTEEDMPEFIAALIEGLNTSEKEVSLAKEMGISIGKQLGSSYDYINETIVGGDSTIKLNRKNFIAGVVDGLSEKTVMETDSAYEYFQTRMSEITAEASRVQNADAIEENAKFLEENAQKEGVKTTASGLQYEVIKEGTGATPTADDTVVVHYVGTLLDGTEFDSSIKRGQPAEFPLGRVIQGWTEGIQLMKTGSKYKFYIPYNLAYGEQGNQGIPPYATLIFDVELLDIKK